jgi:hypothetical protein
MDGEPGAEPHPELPEAFPGVQLGRDLTRAEAGAAHASKLIPR